MFFSFFSLLLNRRCGTPYILSNLPLLASHISSYMSTSSKIQPWYMVRVNNANIYLMCTHIYCVCVNVYSLIFVLIVSSKKLWFVYFNRGHSHFFRNLFCQRQEFFPLVLYRKWNQYLWYYGSDQCGEYEGNGSQTPASWRISWETKGACPWLRYCMELPLTILTHIVVADFLLCSGPWGGSDRPNSANG